MLLIAGLGNPGAKYQNNRHNIGFMAMDAMAEEHGFGPVRKKFNAHVRDGFIGAGGRKIKTLLVKPQTYMNESGRAIGAAAQFYKIPKENIVVFHDELDLQPGKFRMKLGGGIAGHNGLRSIRSQIGPDFWRARLGIGHPGHKGRVHSYVLSDFSGQDTEWVQPLLAAVSGAADLLALGEMDKYQTRVNHLAPSPFAKPQRG